MASLIKVAVVIALVVLHVLKHRVPVLHREVRRRLIHSRSEVHLISFLELFWVRVDSGVCHYGASLTRSAAAWAS